MTKKYLTAVFEDPKHAYFTVVNDILAGATVISILALVLETVPSFEGAMPVFRAIEWATVLLFTLEYGVRVFIAKPKRAYILSFFGIVDLVSILPTFIGLGNLTFLKAARAIRIMRLLRVIRLAKLSRIRMKDAEETFGILGFNITIYALALVLVMLIVGVFLHAFIYGEGEYWSIPKGMQWAFAVFLGGIPAPIPEGGAGLTIFIIAKFCGMALFGLLIGIVGKLFNSFVLGKK